MSEVDAGLQYAARGRGLGPKGIGLQRKSELEHETYDRLT